MTRWRSGEQYYSRRCRGVNFPIFLNFPTFHAFLSKFLSIIRSGMLYLSTCVKTYYCINGLLDNNVFGFWVGNRALSSRIL